MTLGGQFGRGSLRLVELILVKRGALTGLSQLGLELCPRRIQCVDQVLGLFDRGAQPLVLFFESSYAMYSERLCNQR